MGVFRSAICEDDPALRTQLCGLCEEIFKEWGIQYTISDFSSSDFSSAEAAAQVLTRDPEAFDLLLLDIQMEGMSGLELARQLYDQGSPAGIIFITSHVDYALEGYQVHPIHFLVKPVSKTELDQATFALDDDRLTFAGQTESVREYHITVAREEEAMDLQLNDDILYIPSSELTGIVNNGQQVDSLDVPLVEVDLAQQRAAVSRNSEPEEVLNGYFTYTGSAEIEVGDVLSVYDGISPEERTVDDDSDENNAAVSYVKVTSVADNGDGTKRVEYESVETEEVLFLPDAFPISTSADTDGSWNDGSITVAESVFDFSHPNFTYLDLDDTCVVEKGDFIAFYDGYLNIEDARQS